MVPVPAEWAAGFEWEQATRAEARDFCRVRLQHAYKSKTGSLADGASGGTRFREAPGWVNAVTGRRRRARDTRPRRGRALQEPVCRSFYDYHLEAGTGPLADLPNR